MSAIVGERDRLLQATAERFSTTADGKAILMSASTPVFRVNSAGTGAPGSIAITAKPVNVVGDIVFSVSAGTTLRVNGNVATVDFAGMTTDTALVQARIREFGVDYLANYMVSKVFDGVAGETGLAGLNTGQAFAYKRAAAAPADSPGDVIFTFSTAAITTPAGNDLANGWSKNIPAGTTPLYVRVAAASSRNATDNIAGNEWAGAVQLAKDGTDGLNVAPVRIYQRGATSIAPALPSAACTFTFATGALTGLNNGWSAQVPSAGGAYLFTSGATAASRTATDDIAPGEWAAAARLAADGATGQRGTVTVTAPGYSSWSDASAVYELGRAGYGAPINRDVVTLYDATHAVTKYFENGAWLVLGTVLNGNLLVNGSVATQALAADSVTAEKIDARGLSIKDSTGKIILSAGTPLTANYMNAGIGAGNLISNSAPSPPAEGVGGLGSFILDYTYSPGTTTFAPGYAPYVPSGAGGVYVRCTGVVPSGTTAAIVGIRQGAVNRKFPVIPGVRYEFSVYMGAHRCRGAVNVAFYDGSGAYLSELAGSIVDNVSVSGALANFPRSTLFVAAPAGAAYAMLRSVLVGNGGTDAYLFLSMWYFGVALPAQTVPSAWADGPGASFGDNVFGQITPSTSPTYIANAAIVNAQIGGDIYSSNWSGSGSTTGWCLDRNGNLHANSGTFRGELLGASGSFSGKLSAATVIAGRGQNENNTTFIDFNATGSMPFIYAGSGAVRITADGEGTFARRILSPPNLVKHGVEHISPGVVGWTNNEYRPFTVYIDTGHTFESAWHAVPSDTFLANATISGGQSWRGGCNGYGEASIVVGDGLNNGAALLPLDNRIYIRFTWTPVGGDGYINPTEITWKLVKI
ncbi:hypothetical protein FHI69_04465 [Janthinobacterium lividum]|uniref:DUF1983 domain-containing protein n=1 Tax=Janthinobacterium lividum TaxID=29581 RepID=A0A5C4NVS3_9BURK|nr:hypothetical protein [Janthinobacterium lividum]TNC78543.1 hypothetical protein FHI69_04465 [Janthinobacterium lividum]